MAGTASTVRSWLLVQQEGPWGVDALRESRMPVEVGRRLDRECRTAGVRPILIRRHGGSPDDDATRIFAVYVDRHRHWCETTVLDAVDDVSDIDLAALGAGRSTGLAPHDDPLALVCTNGRHDRCCAEFGLPLARALASSHPTITWECSHIGGDRFAGNLVLLPDGFYYGRVTPTAAPDLLTRHLAGNLDLAHVRGRTTVSFVVQAAEVALRRQQDVTEIDAVTVASARRDDDLTHVVFEMSGRRWRVTMRTTRAAPRMLTCRADREGRAPVHAVESITAE